VRKRASACSVRPVMLQQGTGNAQGARACGCILTAVRMQRHACGSPRSSDTNVCTRTHALSFILTALLSAAAGGGLRLRGGMDNCLPVAGAIFDKEKRAKIKVAEILKRRSSAFPQTEGCRSNFQKIRSPTFEPFPNIALLLQASDCGFSPSKTDF